MSFKTAYTHIYLTHKLQRVHPLIQIFKIWIQLSNLPFFPKAMWQTSQNEPKLIHLYCDLKRSVYAGDYSEMTAGEFIQN